MKKKMAWIAAPGATIHDKDY
jgi:hypothetical protein